MRGRIAALSHVLVLLLPLRPLLDIFFRLPPIGRTLLLRLSLLLLTIIVVGLPWFNMLVLMCDAHEAIIMARNVLTSSIVAKMGRHGFCNCLACVSINGGGGPTYVPIYFAPPHCESKVGSRGLRRPGPCQGCSADPARLLRAQKGMVLS